MTLNPLMPMAWTRQTTADPPREEDRMYAIYKSAGDLEMALASAMRRTPAILLTTAQCDAFNAALRSARDMVSSSRALREDIDEVDDTTDAATAYRALHLTLVPTLHNALPDEYFAL